MLRFMNWRTVLTVVALLIVVATIFYSRYLAGKLAEDERQKVEMWAEAHRFIAESGPDANITFATLVVTSQHAIPVIETNEKDSITNFHNIDSNDVRSSFTAFRKNKPIVTYMASDSTKFNRYYYGESTLLKQVRYYPLVQLLIVTLFILVALAAINARHKAEQNQLWAGLAKETAHQLGTPVSALHGWVEMLRETTVDPQMVNEIEKDVVRLKLVSDRFSKIGSTPKLEERDVVHAVAQVVEYVRKRAPEKVKFHLQNEQQEIRLPLSDPLFDWVVENILKNALDAMEGMGSIQVQITAQAEKVIIDITDSGKGMSSAQAARVFNAGFTTKKRGWGLGLTLSKRIIEDYHNGQLTVKSSEPGKGTTFRIVIPSKAIA
jgi:signal transduction histidine kinase